MTNDQELLLRSLDGDLSAAEDAALSSRLAAEPALARELILLARQEALLPDTIAATPVAAALPLSHAPTPPRSSLGGLITMAASTLLFAVVITAIFSAPRPPVVPTQDDKSVAALIDKLRSNDVAERDAAWAELKKLPLEKLPLLEKALASDDAEVAGKVREAVAAILTGAFSRKVGGAELRGLADAKTLKKWMKDGADPKSPPDGFEAIEYFSPLAPKPETLLVRTKPAMTVKADSAKLKEGGANQAGASSAIGGAGVEFAFTDDGDKAFGELATNNYLQVVILGGGKILSRTTIVTPKGGERSMFCRSKDEAQRIVDLFNGKLAEITFRAAPDRADAAKADDAIAALKKVIEKVEIAVLDAVDLGKVDTKLAARVPLEVKAPDLVAAWKALRAIGWKLEAK